MYLPLVAGAAANLAELGAARALTGPIRRADLGTIRAHLAALPPEVLPLYRGLGLAALELAREAGLSESLAGEVRDLLEGNDRGGAVG